MTYIDYDSIFKHILNPLPCHESYRHCIVGQPLLGWSVTNQELFYFKFISHTFVGYVCLRVIISHICPYLPYFCPFLSHFVVRIQDDLFFTAQGSHLALSAYVPLRAWTDLPAAARIAWWNGGIAGWFRMENPMKWMIYNGL